MGDLSGWWIFKIFNNLSTQFVVTLSLIAQLANWLLILSDELLWYSSSYCGIEENVKLSFVSPFTLAKERKTLTRLIELFHQ